jgi:hypothetical protein
MVEHCARHSHTCFAVAWCTLAMVGGVRVLLVLFLVGGVNSGLPGNVCPGGYFTNNVTFACEQCDWGKHQPHSGNSTACIDCSPGRFSDQSARVVCENCPGGRTSHLGGYHCFPHTIEPEDTICPQGRFSVISFGDNIVRCFSCPAGNYQHQLAQSSCMLCPVGKFQPRVRSSSCRGCPGGKFSTTERSGCSLHCPKGFLIRSTTTDSIITSLDCAACPAGRFSIESDLHACTECPAGRYSDAARVSCTNGCAAGSVLGSNRSCALCPLGRHQPSFIPHAATGDNTSALALVCEVCPVGTTTFSKGCPHCSPACPPGKFRDEIATCAVSHCHHCPPGKYQANRNSAACNFCPFGRYQVGLVQTTHATHTHLPSDRPASNPHPCLPTTPRFPPAPRRPAPVRKTAPAAPSA